MRFSLVTCTVIPVDITTFVKQDNERVSFIIELRGQLVIIFIDLDLARNLLATYSCYFMFSNSFMYTF
jgi:hypothetical protein